MSMSTHLLKIYSIMLVIFTLIPSNGVVASGGDLLTWLPTRSGCTLSECLDEGEEVRLGSEVSRRILATTRYISYGALRRNTVPCSKRGASYYNCRTGAQANPYTRGCSAITKCRR